LRSGLVLSCRVNILNIPLFFNSTCRFVDNHEGLRTAGLRLGAALPGLSYRGVQHMDSIRMAPEGSFALWQPCCRCGTNALGWDRIAGKPYCPDCQEAIIQGEEEPLVEQTQRVPCSACQAIGSITVQTFPRQASRPVELKLCPDHLRGLLGRNLAASAYGQLRRQFALVGLSVQEVFLLHEAFYDAKGRARRPAGVPDC
jgi:hypothetical protein